MQFLRLLALLLLLCVSTSRAASLIHARQALEETETPAPPEEDPAIDSPAGEPLVVDSPAAEAPVVNDPAVEAPGVDGPVEEAPAVDSPAADSSIAADVPLETQADSPAEGEAPVADSSVQSEEEAQDTPARDPQVAADEPVLDSPAPEAPVVEAPGMDAPVDAVAAADTPAGKDVPGEALVEDKLAADAPVDDTMVSDAPVDDKMAADSPADYTIMGVAPEGEKLTAQADVADEKMNIDMPVDGMMAADTPVENIPADVQEDAFPLEEDEDIMSPLPPSVQASTGSDWAVNSIRHSFQAVNGYFDSLVELMGGRNGVCQYSCRYGKTPTPRVGYLIPEPNGCSSSLLGFEVADAFDLGIPAMTKCCNQLDVCYDTCGSNKNRCDSKFRWCLHGICSELKKSLGFVSKVEVCESMADAMYNTVWTLGCRSYMSSQRAACFCEGEERDEL